MSLSRRLRRTGAEIISTNKHTHMSRNNLPATVELRPDSCLGFFKWLTVAGRRPDGPCHGRAEELTREGTEGIGGCAVVLIVARWTSGQQNAPSTGMHVSCTNRDRSCSLCHNPVSTATKTSALPILSVKYIGGPGGGTLGSTRVLLNVPETYTLVRTIYR